MQETKPVKSIHLLLFLLISQPVWAASNDPLTTIELKGRSADEVIPIIRPLLAPEDAITGKGNLLIMRTDPATVSQIRQLLKEIDRPLNNLLITVRTGVDMSHEQSSAGVSGNVVINKPGESDIDMRLSKQYQTQNRGSTQQLRVLEGQPAFINVGQAIPYPSGTVVQTPRGGYSSYGIDYREAPQGFYALPRLRGDEVTIEINPRNEQPSPQGGGRIDTTSMHTTVTGRLGEWIRIGGVTDTQDEHRKGIISTGKKKSDEDREVWLRVDLIR
jgi:type II secretory pathway component GspD/PulD (secretin)